MRGAGMQTVCIIDTTLRDGLQHEERYLPLEQRLELVERPVASEEGNYARHDPDKLAEAVLEIYRRRAVRIFRGERRYILEE